MKVLNWSYEVQRLRKTMYPAPLTDDLRPSCDANGMIALRVPQDPGRSVFPSREATCVKAPVVFGRVGYLHNVRSREVCLFEHMEQPYLTNFNPADKLPKRLRARTSQLPPSPSSWSSVSRLRRLSGLCGTGDDSDRTETASAKRSKVTSGPAVAIREQLGTI